MFTLTSSSRSILCFALFSVLKAIQPYIFVARGCVTVLSDQLCCWNHVLLCSLYSMHCTNLLMLSLPDDVNRVNSFYSEHKSQSGTA